MKRLRIPIIFLIVVSALLSAWTLPAAASSQYPSGPYWYAEFFDSRWPTSRPVYTRYDTQICFDWGTGSPNAAVPVDDFSARWTRTVDLSGGTYRFWVDNDDGVLLWIDDQLIINQWYDQPSSLEHRQSPEESNGGPIIDPDPLFRSSAAETLATGSHAAAVHAEEVTLAAGPHRIKVEYYEHGKNAVVCMGWDPIELAPTGVAPCPAAALEHDQIHVVRSGEWLHKIARTYYVDVNIIIQINGLVSTKVTPGQALVIPDASYSHHAGATCPSLATAPSCAATPSYEATGCRAHYVVKRGDNLFRISLKYHVSLSAMAAKNGIRAPHHVYVGQRLCVP